MSKLVTNIFPISDLKSLYIETFLNHNNDVTKVTDLSILNAHAFAVAKLLQKEMKETAILESQIFPQLSSSTYLDNAAQLIGGETRLGATGSSTSVLVIAEVGTIYIAGDTIFTSSKGVQFDMVETVFVGENGYAYIPVRSKSTGVNTNVDALTINSVIGAPIGHQSCTNEYKAQGGRDSESDEEFKIRLSTFGNLVGKQTQLGILEAMKLISNKILKIYKLGLSENGKIQIALLPCDGSIYTIEELVYMQDLLSDYVSLSDLNWQGGNLGIELTNINYQDISIDFRAKLLTGYDVSDIRRRIQLSMTKYFDYRFWSASKVQWDDLMQIVKSTAGVDYVPDEYFNPSSDITIEVNKLPRVKSFIMRDLTNTITYDNNSIVLPIYYGK